METKMENNEVCKCYYQDDAGDSKNKKKEKKDPSPVTVVVKIDFHCEGCIMRIVKTAHSLSGVETVRPDPVSNKLTLIGFMDPVKTAEKLQDKTKKKVELVSPKPKKETPKVKNEPKAEKPNTTMVAVSTVSLKLNCSCDGCTKRIRKTISKTKGVYEVKMDKGKEMATVMGAMEVKNVTENLRMKLNKTVKVVPEKKDKNKDKKEKNVEGITKVGPQVLPPCYGFHPGFGPCGFIEGPRTEFFCEEDMSFCCIM